MPVVVATVGQSYAYQVAIEGTPAPTFQLSAAPTGMSIGASSGTINWVPGNAGSFDVVVLATNNAGTDSQSFRIRVTHPVDLASCPANMATYWQMEEISGSQTFSDIYGNYHATCVGESCPVVASGRVGQAQYFDGNSRVNVHNNSILEWGHRDSFSIELWVNTQQLCSGNSVFAGKYRGGSAAWWLGCGTGGKAIFSLRDSDTLMYTLTSAEAINDGAWHHIVAGRNFAEAKNYLYIDGQLDTSISAPYTGGFANSSMLNIGYYDNNYFFVGMLDEIAIYNRMLEPGEVLSHYQSGLAGFGYCASSAEVAAPVITSSPVQQAVVNQPYRYDVDATGNPAPNYQLMTAPTGMTINSATGLIQWTPDSVGTYSVTVRASNTGGNVNQSFTISVTDTSVAPQITSSPVITGFVGQTYTYDVKATGNPAPTFQLVGAAPGGMSINIDVAGRIRWTPSRADVYAVTVRASNIAGNDEQSFTINVTEPLSAPTITSLPVTVAAVKEPYTYEVQASGYPTPTFQLVNPPNGMTVHADTGLISWVPETAGNYNIKVEAKNSAGTISQDFVVQVRSYLWLPTVSH
ncbi:MAG: putative Ig domain-containing protein [Caldilineaceae bacterium]|nr:putative Ig domain-containing protein [Caldilineaceae bacterium]